MLAARLVRSLGDSYRFVFACLDDVGTLGEQLREEGYPLETIGRRPGIDFAAMRRLARFWQRENVKLVHAHQYTPFFYAMAARGLKSGPPVLFTEHGRFHPDYRRWKRVAFNRLLLRKGDRVVAVGQSVKEALVRYEGLGPERVEVIYNGVDPAAFTLAENDRDRVRAELGVAGDDFVLLQVARLDALKDHATAVRTLERVVRKYPDVRLVLVGDGPQRGAIEREIASRGVAPWVRLLGQRHDLPQLYRAADAFFLTSVSEGIPVTVLEAMAAGLPVIATGVGGLPEIVAPEETGLLAAAGDDAALAAHVGRLARDPGAARRLGEAGRKRLEAGFTQSRMHAAYARRYEEMLGD